MRPLDPKDVRELLESSGRHRKRRMSNKEIVRARVLSLAQQRKLTTEPVAPGWLSANIVHEVLSELGLKDNEYRLFISTKGIFVEQPRREQ